MSWDLSCVDWEARLRAGLSLIPTLPVCDVRGSRAVAVFNKLRLADVPGTPTLDEAGAEWFRDIVYVLFGSLDPVTKARMVRELFLLVPKKNSKTTYGALLMLTALILNERPNASLIMTAPVQDVAELAFDAAAGAIRLDTVLEKTFHIQDHKKTIKHRVTGAELEIMTFDPAVLTGQKPVAVLIDELHVVARMAKAKRALRQLRGGMLPFPEAFMAFITTQSDEPPVGAFKEELTKARAIRAGIRKARGMLPVLYEFPEAMQKARKDQKEPWRDPANWPMVTPNLGKSITLDRLIEEMETATETSTEELHAWASQHLNVEIGLALKSGGWAGAEHWEAQANPDIDLDYLLRWCEVITVGIDGGGLDDLLGASFVGRHRDTREWLMWNYAWAHPSVLKRRTDIAANLQDFADEGDMSLVERVGDDVRELANMVAKVHMACRLDKIGVDQSGLGAILDALEQAGIPGDKITGVPQNFKLQAAIKTAERHLAGGQLWHAGQPLMAWCVGNARVETKGNAIYVTKQASGSAKIDPLMASYNAVELMSRNPEAPGGLEDFLMNPIVAR